MPAKIKNNLKIAKILPDARSNFAKEMKASIVDVIVEKILSGRSPVKGSNNYKAYSKGYAKYKGRKQPVDMNDTGNMLNSLKATQSNDNRSITISFTGAQNKKIAAIHDNGEGKMPQRKLLPTRKGEIFKKEIMDKIYKLLNNAIKLSINKNR